MRFQRIACDGEAGVHAQNMTNYFGLGFRFDDLEKLRRTIMNKYALASKLASLQCVRRNKLEELEKSRIHYMEYGNILRSSYECPVLPLCMIPGSVKDMEMDNTLAIARTADESPVVESPANTQDHEVDIELGASLQAPTGTALIKSRYRKGNCNHLLLLIAAILAILTFHAGLSPVPSYSGALFLWFNSAVFVASEAMIASLALDLPLRPWLLVSVFSFFVTYVCSIITTFPNTALAVLCAGSPLLVFAAASGHVALRTIGFQCFHNTLSPQTAN